MIIDIPAYKYIENNQTIDLSVNKISILIGGNGSGKSTLLESIFSNYIDKENELRENDEIENINQSLRCIVFSSGQNELFSKIFNNYDKNARRYNREDEQTIRSFYFDYWWSRLLIFFATSLKKNGLVRTYLRENSYIDEVNEKDDSSYISFSFRVRKPLTERIINEHNREEKGDFIDNPLLRSLYIRYLEKIIKKKIDSGYSFREKETIKRIVSQGIELEANEVKDVLGIEVDEIFTFIARASSSWLSNFNLENIGFYFKNDLELAQLSDGEYELLSVYAIIDLFDNDNTIFLFDEIDSHLHYDNINNIWDTLKTISGKLVTTTHISESILKNNFDSLLCVNNGKIDSSLTAREVFTRLSNITGQKKYEYKVAAKIEHIALLDDEVDWRIFKKLAAKKIGSEVIQILDKVIPYKRSSSFNTTTEIFGKGKLEFVREFKEQNNGFSINTKNIFLICDRDLLPLTQINNTDLSVNINNAYNDLRTFGTTKTYLHSWRMLEIENYLLSKTMLQYYGKFEDFKSQFTGVNFDGITTFDESEDLRIYDAKDILHPLYKNGGFDEEKLDEVISKIPSGEISGDIVKMYEFIKSKIESN